MNDKVKVYDASEVALDEEAAIRLFKPHIDKAARKLAEKIEDEILKGSK